MSSSTSARRFEPRHWSAIFRRSYGSSRLRRCSMGKSSTSPASRAMPRPRGQPSRALAILQDTLVATILPAFEARLRARERQHPKLYWVDPGIVRAAKQQLGPVAAEERGPLFEGWVLTVLRAHNQQSEVFQQIAYWAPAQARHTEVDFLLRRGRTYLAIEVKAQSRFSTPPPLRVARDR